MHDAARSWAERRAAVERAAREWRAALIDVSAKNRLLYFRRTASTLDLTGAAPGALAELFAGRTIPVSRLFDDPEARESAQRACRALARKEQEAREEYGVSVAFLAFGLATWTRDPRSGLDSGQAGLGTPTPQGARASTPPCAPVLLRTVEISGRRGSGTHELTLVGEAQLNGVLAHVLAADYGVTLDEEAVLEAGDDTTGELGPIYDRMRKQCDAIPGFRIDECLVLGAFSYLAQPMVADCENIDALAESTLVSALAGDERCVAEVRTQRGSVQESDPDYCRVESEYLVLNADASQSYVVNAALAGRTLIVEGPPGTGKSQTIANVIAGLAAEGKRVLFVAQKRAAITAVLDRLKEVGLAGIILDLFAATSSRRYVADQLRASLEGTKDAFHPPTDDLHRTLTTARDTLVRHRAALHSQRHGWGVSVSQLYADAHGIPTAATTDLRFAPETLASWAPDGVEPRARALRELADIGGLDPQRLTGAGWSVTALTTTEAVKKANRLLSDLRTELLLPTALEALDALADELGIQAPASLPGARQLIDELVEATRLVTALPAAFDPALGDAELRRLLAATNKQYRRQQGISIGWRDCRRAERQARDLVAGPLDEILAENASATLAAGRSLDTGQVHGLLRRADSARKAWAERGIAGNVRPLDRLPAARAAVSALTTQLAVFGDYLQNLPLEQLTLAEIETWLGALADDRGRARYPRLHELETELRRDGCGAFLTALRKQAANRSDVAELAPDMLRHAAVHSALEHALTTDPVLPVMSNYQLHDTVADFQHADDKHLRMNAARVRRRVAERLVATLDDHTHQHQVVKKEANRRRRAMPVRQLFEAAPDVVTAARPCWAMSPLQVSRLLPAKECFDVVIFDEASQVKPADAIPALMRARQAVIAGDSRQLPPTDFFNKVLEPPSDEDEAADAVVIGGADGEARRAAAPAAGARGRGQGSDRGPYTRDIESILLAFDLVLAGQARRLLWHYRSRDERLIAVSNADVYDGSLTTFPGADVEGSIRHVVVPPSAGKGGTTNSPQAEVQRVVELIVEHARTRPKESLGVITFGIPHARRIEDALEAVYRREPDLEALLTDRPEPFFIKNLERVQGDERDAIILSVGYGKDPTSGKLRRLWGPLLKDGGERRLNVAISRARRRMTLVTSFEAEDVPENAHPSAGFALMYRFLRFMASGGTDLGGPDGPVTGHALNPFEIDVRDRLTARGLDLVPQHGVGGYRIDFAVRHPSRPDRYVLAIEADGASYHSGHTARERDRLRQRQLEFRGWRFHRIWSTDWFNDPEREVQRVLEAFRDALAADNAREADDRDQAGAGGGVSPSQTTSEATPPAGKGRAGGSGRGPAGDDLAAATPLPRLPRPPLTPGLQISRYNHETLVELVRYIRSDDVVRTREQEQAVLMRELGFARRGRNIIAALEAAQRAVDRSARRRPR